ncbi:MAG: hypothetical protein HIU82_08160 [Proteobacteria bacterium]|nr:hypothetical protein [Pseudomonadota bacterium]
MQGDSEDMLSRLRAVLPSRWFPDNAPILGALLQGLAWSWSWCFGLVTYVRAQTRIATATDVWLDVIAEDFFGGYLGRRSGEDDGGLRRRIKLELFRDHATRAALASALIDMTGRAPVIFEPARTADTGGYGGVATAGTGLGYGVAGGWGSLDLPFQCFVTAYRPNGSGIAAVAGWGNPVGGYGVGALQYATLAMVQGQVTDTEIVSAVAAVMPAASIAWIQISS